jgi:oxygen-dependent protoporphyrinogen oxidase
MPHVVIVGGGLTGLTVAFRLMHLKQIAPTLSITLLESRDRPGGNIGTESHDGFRVERGPNGFLDRTPSIPNLVRDLGLSGRLIAASEGSRRNRYLFVGGRLRQLPRGLFGLVTSRLLSLRGKWQLMSELWRRRPPDVPADESIAAFVARRAGKGPPRSSPMRSSPEFREGIRPSSASPRHSRAYR